MGAKAFLCGLAQFFAFGRREFLASFGGSHEIAEDITTIAINAVLDSLGKDAKVGGNDWRARQHSLGMNATERFDVGRGHEYGLGFTHQFAALFDTNDTDVLAVATKVTLTGKNQSFAEFLANLLSNRVPLVGI